MVSLELGSVVVLIVHAHVLVHTHMHTVGPCLLPVSLDLTGPRLSTVGAAHA